MTTRFVLLLLGVLAFVLVVACHDSHHHALPSVVPCEDADDKGQGDDHRHGGDDCGPLPMPSPEPSVAPTPKAPL